MKYSNIKEVGVNTYENTNVSKKRLKKKGGWILNALTLQLALLLVVGVAYTAVNILDGDSEAFAKVREAFSIEYEN